MYVWLYSEQRGTGVESNALQVCTKSGCAAGRMLKSVWNLSCDVKIQAARIVPVTSCMALHPVLCCAATTSSAGSHACAAVTGSPQKDPQIISPGAFSSGRQISDRPTDGRHRNATLAGLLTTLRLPARYSRAPASRPPCDCKLAHNSHRAIMPAIATCYTACANADVTLW